MVVKLPLLGVMTRGRETAGAIRCLSLPLSESSTFSFDKSGGLKKPRLRAAALGTSGIRGAEMVPNLVGNHGHFKLNLCC